MSFNDSPLDLLHPNLSLETEFFPALDTEEPSYYYIYSMLITCSWLIFSILPLAVFVIYAVLPGLHNVHGLNIMCYVATTFVSYILYGLLIIPSGKENAPLACLIQGILTHYFAVCVYSWMGVICFDMFWTFTFGSSEDKEDWCNTIQGDRATIAMKPLQVTTSSDDVGTSHLTRTNVVRDVRTTRCIRFLKYSVFGWGYPLITVAVCQLVEYVEGFPSTGFGSAICWFRTDFENLIFLTLPNLQVWTVSLVLILWTSCCFRRVNNAYRRNATPRICAVKCALTTLGILWILELVSKDSLHVWGVTALLNVVHAVLLFAVFVCQEHVLRLLYPRCLPLLQTWRSKVPAFMGCHCWDRYASAPLETEEPGCAVPAPC